MGSKWFPRSEMETRLVSVMGGFGLGQRWRGERVSWIGDLGSQFGFYQNIVYL